VNAYSDLTLSARVERVLTVRDWSCPDRVGLLDWDTLEAHLITEGWSFDDRHAFLLHALGEGALLAGEESAYLVVFADAVELSLDLPAERRN
jgi:hypothetical protein